jgi:hypothetical protein
MTDYDRRYTVGTETDYYRTGAQIQIGFSIVGMDGQGVNGTLDASLLTEDQINELCVALQNAGASMSWITYNNVTVTHAGSRTFTVSVPTPPVTP